MLPNFENLTLGATLNASERSIKKAFLEPKILSLKFYYFVFIKLPLFQLLKLKRQKENYINFISTIWRKKKFFRKKKLFGNETKLLEKISNKIER